MGAAGIINGSNPGETGKSGEEKVSKFHRKGAGIQVREGYKSTRWRVTEGNSLSRLACSL